MSNLINHVAFVIDESSSMGPLKKELLEVLNGIVTRLKIAGEKSGQETRVSLYSFSTNVRCFAFDIDISRFEFPKEYFPCGMTALLEAVGTCVQEMSLIPEIHGDHAFLVYVLTDGQDNQSTRYSSSCLNTVLRERMGRENWSFGILVPDTRGYEDARRAGFDQPCIKVWESTKKGMKAVESVVHDSVEAFYAGRKSGKRNSRSLFQVDLSGVTSTKVRGALDPLPEGCFSLKWVGNRDRVIREFCEAEFGVYDKGSVYYQLVKPETVQGYKKIAIQNVASGKVYVGDAARDLLKIGKEDLRLKPGEFGHFRVFIQSTSVNRKLLAHTMILVLAPQ